MRGLVGQVVGDWLIRLCGGLVGQVVGDWLGSDEKLGWFIGALYCTCVGNRDQLVR